MTARIVASRAALSPISSEVRPPYISRTISSRPRRLSAPRKNFPSAASHCGSIGLPSTVTTSFFSPSTVICSTVCSSFGPVPATWLAQSGAARTKATISEKSPRKASARRLRTNRRRARDHCPRSALGSVGTCFFYPEELLEFEAAQVVAEGGVEDDAVEVDLVGDEGRDGAVAEWRPRGELHDFFIQLSVGFFLLRPELLFSQFRDFLVDRGVVELAEVVVVGGLDAFSRQQRLKEVIRMRVVLVPVGPARVEVGRAQVAGDRRDVVRVDEFQGRVEANVLQHLVEVFARLVVGAFGVAPDGYVHIRRVRFFDHLLGFGQVVRIKFELLVARHAGRQDLL